VRGDDGDASSSATSAEPGAAPLPTEDELRLALLTAGDLPTGWAEVAEDEGEDDPLCGIRLTGLLGLDEDALPNAETTLAKDPDTGPLLFEAVGFMPEGRGEEALRLYREAIANCEGDEIAGRPASIGELSFPSLGNESAAYRITVRDPDSDLNALIDIVAIREDDLLVLVAAFDFFGDATDLLQTWAPRAYDKAIGVLIE
jgi:hypothetical protein